jgi:hypothetical protein
LVSYTRVRRAVIAVDNGDNDDGGGYGDNGREVESGGSREEASVDG